MTKNKISIPIVIIIVLALVAGVLWFLTISRDKQPQQLVPAEVVNDVYFPDQETGTPGSGFNETESDQTPATGITLNKMSENAVSAFWVDLSDKTLYTANSAGIITATAFGGSPEMVYGGDGRPFISAEPSLRGDSVILTSGSRRLPSIAVVNVVTGNASFLPPTAISATWHPNGKDVLFLRTSDAKNPAGAYTFNTAKKSSLLLAELALSDVFLSQYDSSSVLLSERPSLETKSSSWTLNTKTGALSLLESNKSLLITTSHPSIGYVTTYAKDGGLTLKRIGSTAGIKMPLTLPQKCTSTKTLVYCGVPTGEVKGMPMSYLEKTSFSLDTLVSMGTNGETMSLWSPQGEEESVDIYKPLVVGDSLYFINRYDNRVYSLSPITK
jgi:hypothetical protein